MSSIFEKNLNKEVSILASLYGLTDSKAFLIWFAKIVFDQTEEEAFESIVVDGPNDKGIDLFFIDDYSKRVIIVQGKYSRTCSSRPKDNSVETLLSCLDWLSSPETLQREGKLELADAAIEYEDAIKNDYLTELWYVYCGPKNDKIDQRIRVFNSNKENQEKRRVCRHCDINLLESLFEEYRGKGRRVEKETISANSKSIELKGAFGKGLITNVLGKELVRLYKKYSDDLFARNVRLFLGAKKGSVNAGIKDTIENDLDKNNFWAYNNGITMICDNFEYDERTQKIDLNNFSIVNGCQTTVSLSNSESYIDENVSVLLRVISPLEQSIDSIIRNTNSQNQIKVWDISSQDRTQQRLQQDFEALNTPIYYQLRRGDLQALPPTKRKKFQDGRKLRIIRHDILAQYMMAFHQRPVIAYKHKSFLFTKYYDEIFPPDIRTEEALFIWRSGELLQDVIREEIKKDAQAENSLEVLILKRGGRLYILAVVGLIAKLRNGPDYLRTITEERITSNTSKTRLEKYCTIATIWYKDSVKELLKIEKKDLSVLVRDLDFFDLVSERIESRYRTMAINEDWMKGAIPVLF